MTMVNGRGTAHLRESWEARALTASKGKFAAVVMAVIFNKHGEQTPALLRAAFPDFRDVALPAFTGCATIVKTGLVVCDMFDRERKLHRNIPAFDSEAQLVGDFRDLADRLKLSDADRIELTEAVKKWVVADQRINHLGEKVVA